ncbi:hypothetical protein Tco_0619294 [Tanacetum coccineum]
MTRSSTKELIEPYNEPERVLHSLRKLFKTTSFDHSSSTEFELFSNYEEQDYVSGIARPKFDKDDKFELKGQFLKELRDNTFSGSKNKDANEHIERVLEIFDLLTTLDATQDQLMLRVFPISFTGAISRCFQQDPAETLYQAWERFKELLLRCPQHYLTNMKEVILFYKGLDVLTRQVLDSKGGVHIIKADDAKKAIQKMADYSQKWHNGASTKNKIGCELCGGPHYSKYCSLKEEEKTFEEAYYTQFGVPFPNAGRYRAAAPGFYQRDNENPSYQERRQTTKESSSKFMAESAKRHDETLL